MLRSLALYFAISYLPYNNANNQKPKGNSYSEHNIAYNLNNNPRIRLLCTFLPPDNPIHEPLALLLTSLILPLITVHLPGPLLSLGVPTPLTPLARPLPPISLSKVTAPLRILVGPIVEKDWYDY